MHRSTVVLLSLVGVVAVVLLAVGGWQLGWWLKSNATNRSAHIYQQSYGAQTADVQQVQSLISEVDGIDAQVADPTTTAAESVALLAQKTAIVVQACGVAANITSAPTSVAQWTAANCGTN